MEYSRFALEEFAAFREEVRRSPAADRVALALRLDRLRRGHVGDTAALGHGVFELRQPGLPVVHVHRRAARVTALCLGQSVRIAMALAAGNAAQARHAPFDAMHYIDSDEDAALYLELALAGDPGDVIQAVNQLARVRRAGMRALAWSADMASVARRIAALGFRLRVARATEG